MHRAPHLRLLRATLVVALSVCLPLGGPALADTQLGPVMASGEVSLGYRGVSNDFRSAKFEQYRDESPGLIAASRFLLEDQEGEHFFQGRLDHLTNDNQEYQFEAGRYGRYRIEGGLSQFWQVFSNNGLSPYSGTDTLSLPPGFVPTDDGAVMEAQLLAFSGDSDLKFRQRNYTAGVAFWPQEELLLSANYALRDRDGTRPAALNFGSPGGRFVNFSAPVDDLTHNWTSSAVMLRDRWNLKFGYNGSNYDNDADSVTVENPTLTGSTTVGRLSREPDNRAHQFSVSGATQLPGEMPARVAGTLAYGLLRQDESFLPHSANPVGANPALPQNDLDGEVRTLLANLVVTARPRPELNVVGRYRYYDRDNETDSVVFTSRVRNDQAAATAGLFVANPMDYRRQNASLDASYRLATTTKVTAGYEWVNRYREDRNATRTNDHVLRLAADYRPQPWTWVRASYEFRTRDYNSYDPGSADPGLRHFDMADRVRNQIDVVATLMPRDDVTLSLTGGYGNSDYDNKSFGLDDEMSWVAGIDATYDATEWLTLNGFYTFDRTRWDQDGSTSGGWVGRNTNKTHDVGMGANLVLIPGKLDARLSYHYHWAKAETEASGAAGTAVDYPSIKDNLQVLSAMFDHRLRDNMRLEWGYRFERFNGTDFKFDDLGLTPPEGTADVQMSNNVDDYKAHILLATVTYEF